MKLKNNSEGTHAGHVLHLTINKKEYQWSHQYISGAKLKEIANIPLEEELFLAIKRPWEDELISNDTKVDLAREGIEHFFSKKNDSDRLVKIFVNDIEKQLERGKYSVAEIKKIGDVPADYELDELVNGKLISIPDSAFILIKGCEQFFSRVKDGKSS